jgi:uncharacterized surface protein with fasciclin (FAS1) repeats
MKLKHIFPFVLPMLLLLFSCSEQPQGQAGESGTAPAALAKGQSTVQDDESAKNILQIAIGSADHSTLVAAVQAAGLEDVLVNAGPLTVFAPTNAAFEALPAGTVEELLKPENKEKLARIIKFHAAPGKYTADLLKDGQKLFVATGHYLDVKKDGDKITVNGANVLGSVEASNGLVFVVDAVFLPPD